MCQFNVIVLPATKISLEIDEIFVQNDFSPLRIYNSTLAKQLPSKIFIIAPKNQCDCGSIIASAGRLNDSMSKRENELRKLTRKGWGETKITSYFANKEKALSYDIAAAEIERKKWGSLIADLFSYSKTPSVGILAHYCKEDISTEEIILAAKILIKRHNFSTIQLEGLSMEVYYEIQA